MLIELFENIEVKDSAVVLWVDNDYSIITHDANKPTLIQLMYNGSEVGCLESKQVKRVCYDGVNIETWYNVIEINIDRGHRHKELDIELYRQLLYTLPNTVKGIISTWDNNNSNASEETIYNALGGYSAFGNLHISNPNFRDIIVESITVMNDRDFEYGSNKDDFNDKRVKYLGSKKMLYLVSKQGDIKYICGIDIGTGLVLISSTKADNIEALLRNPIQLARPMNVLTAYKNFDICFNMLTRILKRYHMRIPSIVFTATNNTVKQQIERRFRVGTFKSLFRRYRYIVADYAKEHNGVFMYRLSNQKTIDREKEADKKVSSSEENK